MRTPGDSAMLCRFAHVQSVTFFAHAVVCTVILRRGRGSATFGSGRPRRTRATSVEGAGGPRCIPGYLRAAAGPGRPRHTRATSAEGAGGTAGPGRASSRRAEPQARGADGERAGGPDGTRNTGDAATTSVSEGGGRAWPPTTHPCHQCGGCCRDRRAWPLTTHPRHQCGGCRRAKAHSRVSEGGGRAWPGFEIDYSEPKARVWRSRGRAAALRHQDRFTRSRRHREPERRAGGPDGTRNTSDAASRSPGDAATTSSI